MKKRSYEKKKSLCGYVFISLWLIGTLVFFVIPLIKSLIYSLSDVQIGKNQLITSFSGVKNYSDALFSDRKFSSLLSDTLIETLWKTPLILIFSLFIAVLLNHKFKGRSLARAIFFLPVIIATGPAYSIISGDMASSGNNGAEQFSTLFSNDLIGDLMHFFGIYELTGNFGNYVTTVADNIFSIIWSSGIQIVIFLAALQNIPTSAREAAEIEGATGWEYFWKITLPYVSPFILANFIFTVTDAFANPTNDVMKRISEIQSDINFGLAAAMAWIYFLIVLIIIGIVCFLCRNLIYYDSD